MKRSEWIAFWAALVALVPWVFALTALLVLNGCGLRAEFAEPGWYRCEMPDGTVRRYHTDQLQAYIGIGTEPWIVDQRTGKQLPEMRCVKGWP